MSSGAFQVSSCLAPSLYLLQRSTAQVRVAKKKKLGAEAKCTRHIACRMYEQRGQVGLRPVARRLAAWLAPCRLHAPARDEIKAAQVSLEPRGMDCSAPARNLRAASGLGEPLRTGSPDEEPLLNPSTGSLQSLEPLRPIMRWSKLPRP